MKSAPKTVSVDLTEPPASGAEFTVTDGCNEVVSADSSVDANLLSTQIQGGAPGKWKAQYRVVSSVDGHLTKDSWAFTVQGKKDCSSDDPKKGGNNKRKNDDQNEDPDLTSDVDEDEGGFPVVPVLIGTGLLIALALGIRLRASR